MQFVQSAASGDQLDVQKPQQHGSHPAKVSAFQAGAVAAQKRQPHRPVDINPTMGDR